jgi:hypothetical protein
MRRLLPAFSLGILLGCASERTNDYVDMTLDTDPTTGGGSADAGGRLDAGAVSQDASTPGPDGGGALDAGAFDSGLDGSSSADAGGNGDGDAATDGGPSSGDGGPSSGDGGDVAADAGTLQDAGPGSEIIDDAGVVRCDFGTARSVATADTVNLFGQIVYFADGFALPAGAYEVIYEDGCMKYASSQAWTIHAYNHAGFDHRWWLIGESSEDRKVTLPGSVGITVGGGGFATFDECVAANVGRAPLSFEHTGGKLGVWLHDTNYPDNITGVDGRNPRWRLERIGGCLSAIE